VVNDANKLQRFRIIEFNFLTGKLYERQLQLSFVWQACQLETEGQCKGIILPAEVRAGPTSRVSDCFIPDDVLIQFGTPDDEHLLLETCKGMK
jgi:hypothetical protein